MLSVRFGLSETDVVKRWSNVFCQRPAYGLETTLSLAVYIRAGYHQVCRHLFSCKSNILSQQGLCQN